VTKCLIALGSNVGDRAATLHAAIEMLRTVPGVDVVRQSRWHSTAPLGGSKLKGEFLNGAAVIHAAIEPHALLRVLHEIEAAQGRRRQERWADRTLDLDLLLDGNLVCDLPGLVLPHPRMSFRRFVLEPAVEIAGDWVHPTIGWTLDRLLEHLNSGAECIAILSPTPAAREALGELLVRRYGATPRESPRNDALWPAELTTWLAMSHDHAGDTATSPKLSILLDPPTERDAAWGSLARLPDRGPTLRIANSPAGRAAEEAFAAVESVWPQRFSRKDD
jgi:2-amino-4-hydroxy-6-hydroxymethyldihydropteridine diphosphokinase